MGGAGISVGFVDRNDGISLPIWFASAGKRNATAFDRLMLLF